MYTPKYELTPQLLSLITTIERYYGQIEALKIPAKLELNLTRDNLVKSSYASNRIEGNPLSEAEVTNLLLNDRVPTNRDEKEVINYFTILKHIHGYKDRPITLSTVIDLHKQLMSGVDTIAGHIRDVAVVIGHYKDEKGDVSLRVKHNPPFHKKDQIEKALQELLDWTQTAWELPAVIQTGLFHHQFVYLHPFEDGNGRVCRILTYFAEGMKYSLQSALSKYTDAMKTLRFEEQPSPKEREALRILEEYKEITAPKVAELLHVSRQQAHALLRALVDKGLVEKKGITKRSYYMIK